jgi:hypothetical protein
MSRETQTDDLLDPLARAAAEPSSAWKAFGLLAEAMADRLGYKVFTILRINPATLRSVRLYSSEPSYPVGGLKQHQRSAWSDAIFEAGIPFVAPGLDALRATFPDSAAIEAVGCGSVLAVPIIASPRILGTMNLWHRDGYYDAQMGAVALPFAKAVAPACERTNPPA